MTFVVAGDIVMDECVSFFDSQGFQSSVKEDSDDHMMGLMPTVPSTNTIMIENKPSISCLWALPLPFDINDDSFMPTKLAVDILGGGGFSGRLMSTVREQSGLTYRIASAVKGIEKGLAGYWYTIASFGHAEFEEGIRQTEYQHQLWFDKGITEQELEQRQQSLLGQQALSWTRTTSIAQSIMYGLMNGFGADYLTKYPELVQSVTLAKANQAIRDWGDPAKAIRVWSGTLPDMT